MLRECRKAENPQVQNKGGETEGRETERLRKGSGNCPSATPHWVCVFITRFLVLSLRNGLMSVYRA